MEKGSSAQENFPSAEDVEAELSQMLSDVRLADAAYDRVRVTERGRVLNTDSVREISPHYQSVAGRLRFTNATYRPSSSYMLQRIIRSLESPESFAPSIDQRVLMLAGGPASGKSSSVRKPLLERSRLIIDSTFSDYKKSKLMVEKALQTRWQIDLLYVHRPFEAAVRDMIVRAEDTGRFVPLGQHLDRNLATLHYNSQRVFSKIVREYADDLRVYPVAFYNRWTRESPFESQEIIPNDSVAPGAPFSYSSIEELYVKQAAELRKHGTISAELREALGI